MQETTGRIKNAILVLMRFSRACKQMIGLCGTGLRTDLVQHAQNVLLTFCSHHVLCLAEGVDVKPHFKATEQQKQAEQRAQMNNPQQHSMSAGGTPADLFRSSKTSGRRKLRRDQSSARLFWRGVPVSSSLLSVGSRFSSLTSRQLRFLIL